MDSSSSPAPPVELPSGEARPSFAPGDLVADKYRIERVLGRGSMGVVVAARHVQLDQLVALKLVDRESAKEPVLVERFLREARAAAKLRSDHVARVLDVGILPDGGPYMVMELLEGADLGAVLDRSGPLDSATACEYVVQACEAVAEAHALGIVHRDLKPDNLYLTTRVGGHGMVKVLDFGISKVMSAQQGALTQTRVVIGSPLYMAPEQLRSSRRADTRSDVWALGVVLYELLTRRWPFEADSLPDLCVKVASEAPRPIGELRDDLPAGLAAVLERCLAKDPAERFENAAELAAALEPFVPEAARIEIESARKVMRTLAATQPGEAPSVTPRVPPRRGVRWIAGAVALAAVAAATVALVPWGAERPAFAMAALDAASAAWTAARTPGPAGGGAPAREPAPAAPPAAAAKALTPVTRGPSFAPTHRNGGTVRGPAVRTFAGPPKPAEDDIPAFR